jgi:hypothetical protein
MSLSLASLNAASSRHRHHKGRRRRHRAEGAGLSGSRKDRITYFVGEKAGVFVVTAVLGYTQGNGGEPLFFSDDPSKAVGLKLLTAIGTNAVQLFQVWSGWSFEKLVPGMLGVGLDGLVAGSADGSFGAWNFDQWNLYGAAKRSSTGTAGRDLDYSARRRQMPTGRPAAAALPADYRQYPRGEGPSIEERTRQAVAMNARGSKHDPWMNIGKFQNAA